MLLDFEKLRSVGWSSLWQAVAAETLLNPQSLFQSAPLADQDLVNAVLSKYPQCV